jgi:hypothetical protein
MRALIVYESMFGNTQTIAKAIRDGISTYMQVDLTEVGNAPATIGDDVQLIVAGGPTQAFGMSRPGTREGASKQAEEPLVSTGIGVREWLDTVQGGGAAIDAAAFDTRLDKPHWLTGSAARGIDKRLRRLGFRVIAAPESFFVTGTSGPLADGEQDRGRRWGERLANQVAGKVREHRTA